jgi:hypothetical protein
VSLERDKGWMGSSKKTKDSVTFATEPLILW